MNSPDNSQQEGNDKSLSEEIAEQFDTMTDGDEEEQDFEEVEVSEEVGEEAAEEPPEELAEEPPEEVETTAEENQEQLQEEIQEASDSDYSEPAPDRWPDEIKEVYNGLPPVARKAMLEGIYKPMQRSYTQTTQELSQMRKGIEPMLNSLNQYRGDFERMGVNPVDAFRTQMAWASHLARVGPEQGMKDMQAAYGLQPQQPQGQEEYLTPTERALKQQIDELQQRQQAQDQQMTQRQQWEQQQRVEAAKAEINRNLQDFINEKTEDGNPKHPHVEKVANGIAGVIRGGLVSPIDDYGNPVPMRVQIEQAYHKACALDPSIRPATQNTGQAQKAIAAQQVGVVSNTPSTIEAEELPLSDFLSRQFDNLKRKAG